jgi:putative RNA 2'-phosphotransferase
MMNERNTHISKFLALVLRHKPEEIGIRLDEAGWVEVEVLLEAMGRNGECVSREELEEVVTTNDKKRFALSGDGRRIRANQGHSVDVDLHLPAVMPPEILYHGTADRFLEGIRKTGLQKGQRQHVHLSETKETGETVGKRHGRPVVLQVRAGDMHRAGRKFWRSENGVWLTEVVPAEFIVFPG